MVYFMIALLPTTIYGVYTFGLQALLVIGLTVATAVVTEYLYQKIMHQEVTIGDFKAASIGLVLALSLSPVAPWWMCILGSFFAIIVVKRVRFVNPPLGAKMFLFVLFAEQMKTYVYEGVITQTPLALMKAGENVDILDMLIGNTAGAIGETSTIAILIGAIFLIVMGVISVRIPVAYILSFLVFIVIFGGRGLDASYIATHLCGGGLMFGAWFLAGDKDTAPSTKSGQILYGICLGILTGVFRLCVNIDMGVSLAIICCNILAPLFEKIRFPIHIKKMCNVEIRKCKEEDIVAVGEFYDRVVAHLNENINYPKWTYKEYPSEKSVKDKTEKEQQFICMEGDNIVGAFVLNDDPEGKYDNANWSQKLSEGEYMVCHTLATDPAYSGKGIGKSMVDYCITYAKEHGFKGVRLDVVPDNVPARKLYEKCGFQYAGEVDLERNIPEIPTFVMYELNF